jgi:hypothetical protein
VRAGEVRAGLTARVFAKDFDRVLGSIESLGKVVNKDVREEASILNADVSETENPRSVPRSVIDISFVEPEPSGTNLALAAGATAGGVTFAALLAFLIYASYRTGLRRSPDQS